MDLQGRTILVTGAASRIGKGIAIALAQRGANIALHYHQSKTHALDATKEISTLGVKVNHYQADLAHFDEVQKMQENIRQDLGTVYGVVNNAGFVQMKSFFDYEPGEWQRELDVCLNGVMNVAYAFLPEMKEQRQGKFITIVGDSARTGDRKLIISAAARNGAISFMKSLAQEVGRDQIQCNTVSLGLIDQGELNMSESVYERVVKAYPLNRLGAVHDVTGAIDFLMSRQADWITGQVISVNGGYSMMG